MAGPEVELQLTNQVLQKNFLLDTPHVEGYAKLCLIEQVGFLFSPQWAVKHVGPVVFGVESLLANTEKSSSNVFLIC